MKLFTNKKATQKITLILLIVILFNFLIPPPSKAVVEIGGDLLKELVNLFIGLGDVINGMMNHFFLGTKYMYSSAILAANSDTAYYNLTDPSSSLYFGLPSSQQGGEATPADAETLKNNGYTVKTFDDDQLFEAPGWFVDVIQIPNILYCPENIFANKIAMLDINFINPNTYDIVDDSSEENGQKAAESILTRGAKAGESTLQNIIASWYRAFRNISIVGLLIVLVYIGIRIMISSTSSDKAKYKENLQDWLVAMCLVFFIHYIMAGILYVTESFTDLIDKSVDASIYVDASNTKENDMFKDDSLSRIKI